MDTDELKGIMIDALAALRDLTAAQDKFNGMVTSEVERLWSDNAALRDDLHALANRLEANTRAV